MGFPDGRSLLITANEPGAPLRSYRQPIDGGPPQPVTPRGVFGMLSPVGDRILAREPGEAWQIYRLNGDPPTVAPGLLQSDQLAASSSDGAAVFVFRVGDVPLRLERVNLATGERTPSVAIGPEGEAGVVRIRLIEGAIDPQRPIAYSFQRRLSRLYLVEEIQR